MNSSSTKRRRITPRAALDVTATFAMLCASVVVVYSVTTSGGVRSPSPVAVPTGTPLNIAHAELRGRATAGVVLVVFSDFQCPFCARFASATLPQLVRRYVDTGKVLMAYRYLPLEQLHPQALGASAAAACAGLQGQFWHMHDALFQNQASLDRPSLDARARALGLDLTEFGACIDTAGISRVRADMEIADEVGIDSTPYFLLGQRDRQGRFLASGSIRGARPLADFAAAIDKLLSGTPSMVED